ncbi:MAG: hypothetical protein L6Q71_06325 [Planctomycetes bacterium]|nr:hypothetical protein [Planctomycetota bacterium]NUQ34413.1 hypothetical protein [Planctomycetaceae bacterium]
MARNEAAESAANDQSEQAKEDAFVERLTFLAKQHTMRGLARRVDVPNPTVSRYIRKGLPAASFCRRLVERVGVNPSWLLTGEGSPMITDAVAVGQASATDLLELVQAMGAVTKMRLGALAGNQSAKVLRELNDAMVRYEELRAKLNEQSRETFSQIVKSLDAALGTEKDTTRAESLIKAGEQISRLCDDPELEREFTKRRSFHAWLRGDASESSRLAREVFLQDLMRRDELDAAGLQSAWELAGSLRMQLRLRDARRIAETALLFAGDDTHDSQGYNVVLEAAAMTDIDLGDLRRGQERLAEIVPRMPNKWCERSTRPMLGVAHFLGGGVSYEAARGYSETPMPYFLAFMALWTEEEKHLEDVQRHAYHAKTAHDPRVIVTDAFVKHLLMAKRGKSSGAVMASLHDSLAKLPAEVSMADFKAYVVPVIETQIAIAAGDTKHALSSFEKSDSLSQASPSKSLFVMFAGIHHRNALRLSADSAGKKLDAARARALDFFKRYIDAGYWVFCAALP